MIAASRAPRGGAVDAGEDLPDVAGREGAREAAGCGAVGAAQPETDLTHSLGGDGIRLVVHAVDVPDRGAGQVEATHGDPGFGAFGEVGAQRG